MGTSKGGLRMWRLMAGYNSVDELAAAAGVASRTVRRAENGECYPSLEAAELIARALGIPMEQLTLECRVATLRRQEKIAARRAAKAKEGQQDDRSHDPEADAAEGGEAAGGVSAVRPVPGGSPGADDAVGDEGSPLPDVPR